MNVKLHLENASKESCANESEFTVPPAPCGSVSADSTTTTQQHNVNNNNNAHLQILQMAGMQMIKTEEENQESLFHQLYSMGNNSFGAQNQYMHHGMFGANGESFIHIFIRMQANCEGR